MPVLALEPFYAPENLFTVPLESHAGRWWVLHTRPRAEKSLARRLLRAGSAFFVPLYRRRWRCRNRMLCSHLPLFPGYVFLLGDDEARVQSLQTNLVAGCLQVPGQEQLHSDLSRVHDLMVSGAPLAPEERIVAGTWVEIVRGPFAGLEGKVIRCGKKLKLCVQVNFLQRGASVELEAWMLRQLDSKPA